eukprot:4526830-Pleurochrysis_carterae.AAC.3
MPICARERPKRTDCARSPGLRAPVGSAAEAPTASGRGRGRGRGRVCVRALVRERVRSRA